MNKPFKFNVGIAIVAAWELLWADNLKRRASKDTFRISETYYLTAADMECQVRRFAEDTYWGKPWSKERQWGKPCSGARIRFRGDLQRTVRSWLLGQVSSGKFASHNFGRGHISGMRFRPAGEPISAVEVKTMKAKEARRNKPRLNHFSKSGFDGRPLCTEEQRKKRHGYSSGRSQTWCSSKPEEVNCVRCMNLLKKKEAA